ncbi:MAG: isoprenylcysteine carboxylmethyltransferase family protein [Anaerolineales bacterium]|nr:isoprenylcysteine carboxylmethyltransferase family protein [Anaerolineales bacterium]
MMRLVTFLAGTAFLALMGAVMFLIAGTIRVPSIWLYLGLRLLFTLASVLAMSESVARERMRPGPGVKPEPIYNTGTAIAWVAHILIVPLDKGHFGWSDGFPVWLQAVGVVIMLCAYGLVIWALRHNEYMSARIRIQGERGQQVIDTGPYALIRHPNYAGAFLQSLTSGLIFASWPSILPMLLHMGLLIYRVLSEEKVLRTELEGYREYTTRVRYRFIPGVW